jgi:hypothetical protein
MKKRGGMQVTKWVLLPTGLIGAMVLAVVLVNHWLNWRKRGIVEAGARIGLTALAEGEKLIVPLVPLIDRPRRKYLVILAGTINGYSGWFFDLFVGTGENWNLQSAVLLRDPDVGMPRFQLRTPQWSQMNQRLRGDSVGLPGREHEMRRLKLTSDDPDWALNTFSRASSSFLKKVQQDRWTIKGLDHDLVIYRWGMRVPTKRLKAYVEQAADLAAEMLSLCGQVRGLRV